MTVLQTAPFDRLQLITTACALIIISCDGCDGRVPKAAPVAAILKSYGEALRLEIKVCPQPIGIGMGEGR